MPDATYSTPAYLRGDMVGGLSGSPVGSGNPSDPDQTITLPGVQALGAADDIFRLVWHTNLNGTDTEFMNGQVWRLEVYDPSGDIDGDMTTGSEGWSTVPGYETLTPKNDLVSTGGDPTDGLGAGDEYLVFEDQGGSGTFLLYDINGGLPTTPTDLKQFDLNLNHLTLPKIKDFNALGDTWCFRSKSKRYRVLSLDRTRRSGLWGQ